MAATRVVKIKNQKTGVIYLYEDRPYWDKEKKRPTHERKCIGKISADGKAESYGGYYCWGKDIDKDSSGSHKVGKSALSGADDTATKLWGSKWRMPTKTELQGLIDNCDVAWTTVNDKTGRKFTGKGAYASNSVFLPAAGECVHGDVDGLGIGGSYWSSTPNGSNNAFDLHFLSGNQGVYKDLRDTGYSVRAVLAE